MNSLNTTEYEPIQTTTNSQNSSFKKVFLSLMCLVCTISVLAQGRDYRAMPEDYTEFDALSQSSAVYFEYIMALICGLCVFIVCTWLLISSIKTKIYQKKVIRERIVFCSRFNCIASTTLYPRPDKNYYSELGEYFTPECNKVLIPGGSECTILQYIKEDLRVKVKFDEFPEPLYVYQEFLYEADQRITHFFATKADIVAATTPDLLKKGHACHIKCNIYFEEDNGYVLIPSGARFTLARDVPPHYTWETKVYFDGYPTALYIHMTQTEKI